MATLVIAFGFVFDRQMLYGLCSETPLLPHSQEAQDYSAAAAVTGSLWILQHDSISTTSEHLASWTHRSAHIARLAAQGVRGVSRVLSAWGNEEIAKAHMVPGFVLTHP